MPVYVILFIRLIIYYNFSPQLAQKALPSIISAPHLGPLLLSLVLFALVYGTDMFFLSSYYGMPYIQAPLMSLMFMQGCGLDITIGTFIIIRLIVRLAIMLMVYAVTYVLCSLLQGIRARAVSMFIIIAVIVFVVVMGNISMW